MDSREVQATARVHLHLEVDLLQPWGSGSTVKEITESATREAKQYVLSKLLSMRARLVSDPEISMIITKPLRG